MTLSRQKLTLIGIFALFMGPVILVMLMRSSWWDYQPGGLKNQGQLIQPPVQLPLETTENTDKKWLILYVLDQPCDESCVDEVTILRQIHRAAGRRADNLEIVLLSESTYEAQLQSQLQSIYPEFNLVSDSSAKTLEALQSINQTMHTGQNSAKDIHTYIIDPNLNAILAYEADANPNDLHKDLKRLLKWADQENR